MQRDEEFTIDDVHPEGSLSDERYFNPDRPITRPSLRLKSVIIKIIAVLLLAALCGIAVKLLLNAINVRGEDGFAFAASSLTVVVAIIIKLKSILIWFVLVYQRFAPEEVRKKCVFTPSCSEYMILALKKYGVVKGLLKGINRLKRCHLPNHGEDYP